MPLRVVFMGSDPIAVPLLEWSTGHGAAGMEVVGLFTQPDRPAGRGQKTVGNPIKAWGMERGVPIFQPEKIGVREGEQLAALKPDLALVMAYGHILRDEVIGVPRLGTLNLHASILPRFRGASPIQAAIATGERETGVSLMRIVRRLDAGPVADVERLPIGVLDTAIEVESKLALACVPLLERNLPKLAEGELTFIQQDERLATYCRKLNKADGALDFRAPAEALAARINGLFPWPSCAATIGGTIVRFGLADTVPNTGQRMEAGSVIGSDGVGMLVATGDGALRIRRLQRPGGKMLDAAAFLRGNPIPGGTLVPSTGMHSLVEVRP